MYFVSSTHIWGSNIIKQKYVPHSGDFNTYFNNDQVKASFLQEIKNLFNDGKARYFVPEVNKPIYVQSIVSDLRIVGVEFVEHE